MTASGIPDPAYRPGTAQVNQDAEKIDLLKKIAGLLTAIAVLAAISVVLQIVGLVMADRAADDTRAKLDSIRSNTASVTP